MIGDPTTDEMSDALVEFHQRNQSLVKPVGPPPPFEVTSVVVQQQPVLKLSRSEEDPPPDVDQRALVRPETEFDFDPIAIFGTVSFVLQMWFRCHNQGTIGEESYIRLYTGSFWRSVNPPGYSGNVAIAFNGSTWTPTAHDEQGAFVQMWVTPLNIPPAPNYLYEAHVYFAMYVQQAASPHKVSDAIYPVGQVPFWSWYGGVNNGVGVDIIWHDSP